ncbi:hypothetical protein JOD67_006730 [Tenggerimyces flavus]|nr:hypothetical protein [Tenggerimyces flavus]
MPTYEISPRFAREHRKLTAEQRVQFASAVGDFIAELGTGQFTPRLRVKRVQGTAGVWEMTWAPDGRATFEFGRGPHPGVPHVIWRRIGTHEIFSNP